MHTNEQVNAPVQQDAQQSQETVHANPLAAQPHEWRPDATRESNRSNEVVRPKPLEPIPPSSQPLPAATGFVMTDSGTLYTSTEAPMNAGPLVSEPSAAPHPRSSGPDIPPGWDHLIFPQPTESNEHPGQYSALASPMSVQPSASPRARRSSARSMSSVASPHRVAREPRSCPTTTLKSLARSMTVPSQPIRPLATNVDYSTPPVELETADGLISMPAIPYTNVATSSTSSPVPPPQPLLTRTTDRQSAGPATTVQQVRRSVHMGTMNDTIEPLANQLSDPLYPTEEDLPEVRPEPRPFSDLSSLSQGLPTSSPVSRNTQVPRGLASSSTGNTVQSFPFGQISQQPIRSELQRDHHARGDQPRSAYQEQFEEEERRTCSIGCSGRRIHRCTCCTIM